MSNLLAIFENKLQKLKDDRSDIIIYDRESGFMVLLGSGVVKTFKKCTTNSQNYEMKGLWVKIVGENSTTEFFSTGDDVIIVITHPPQPTM